MDRLLRYFAPLLCMLMGVATLMASKPATTTNKPTSGGDLVLVGIGEADLPGGLPKFLELHAINAIPDLSIYGLGTANNGGGSDGQEYTFPADAIPANTSFFIARDSANFNAFFGFDADYFESGVALNFNGNDAVELFANGTVIDVYGDINASGTGTAWDYVHGWAKRKDSTGPDGTTFVQGNWTYSGINVFDNQTTNATSLLPYPLTTFQPNCPPVGGGGGSIALVLKGIIDGPVTPMRATEFEVIADINDLSVYGIGCANNGGGTDGEEWSFPQASAKAGDRIYVARDSAEFRNFFGFDADYYDSNPDAHNFNGDDAIEIFKDGVVIETYGDANVDGTGAMWEYTDGWAHRIDGTGPDSTGFVQANWEYSPLDNYDGTTTNAGSPVPYPVFGTAKTSPDLVLVGLIHGNALVKCTEYYVLNDIPDLSIYGLGCANNGGGSDSVEYTFPAVSASEGDRIYVARDSAAFRDFFGFDATFYDPSGSGAHNFNGDDAFEVFENGVVIDIYGEINVDGSGEPWEYNETWAQRNCATGPDSSTFVLSNWTISTIDNFVNVAVNDSAPDPYPVNTYLPVPCGPIGGGTDLVMTEIMYNPPGSDLEFIEFYNNTTSPIDMEGYSISDAITYTFTNLVLQPGEYAVITDDSVGMANFWGVTTARQWTAGSLNNSGESITLIDAANNVVDSVRFDDGGNGWTTTPDGRGPSLILCDPDSNNNVGSSWSRSTVSSGNLFDGREVFGSPGVAEACQTNPLIAIQAAEVIIGEAAGDITVLFYIDNPDANNATTVDIAIGAGATADAGDFTFTPGTITFPAGTDTAQFITIPINDDGDQEPQESFTLVISNPTNGAAITNDTMRISIIDNDAPPTYALKLIGLVHGPNSGVPKAVELLATDDIPNLSLFGLGCANNGGGSDGQEYTFPPVAISKGTCFFVANDTAGFRDFFGIGASFQDEGAANNFNGDDAFEVFESGQVIDVFGEIDADGTGTAWEYTLGWAHRISGTGPDTSTFVLGNWEFSDLNEFVGQPLNDSAAKPYPVGMCGFVSVEGPTTLSPVKLFPNPADNMVRYETRLPMQQIQVLNLMGQTVVEVSHPFLSGEIDLSALAPDVYLIRFSNGTTSWTEKLMIQR